jgi:hypothetical protein
METLAICATPAVALVPPDASRPVQAPCPSKAGRSFRLKQRLLRVCPQCAYCGRPFGVHSRPTLDHWHPRAAGGKNTVGNLKLACRACNKHKDCRTPREWLEALEAICERLRQLIAADAVRLAAVDQGNEAIPPSCIADMHAALRLRTVRDELHAVDCASVSDHARRPARTLSTRNALMAKDPHCSRCGRQLQSKDATDRDTYARLIRGPGVLACRKCSGYIAAAFHAERTAAAAVQEIHSPKASRPQRKVEIKRFGLTAGHLQSGEP